MDYRGVIIEESLGDKAVLGRVRIVKTDVYPVNERHKTPWLEQWTLHTVEVPEAEAAEIASEIAASLDRGHSGSWYADFRNDQRHLVVFSDRVFEVTRERADEGYEEVRAYGRSVGIPDYQLDFEELPRDRERTD